MFVLLACFIFVRLLDASSFSVHAHTMVEICTQKSRHPHIHTHTCLCLNAHLDFPCCPCCVCSESLLFDFYSFFHFFGSCRNPEHQRAAILVTLPSTQTLAARLTVRWMYTYTYTFTHTYTHTHSHTHSHTHEHVCSGAHTT